MADGIHELVFERARTHPDKEALVDQRRRMTYSALAGQLDAMQNALLAAGLERRERVAVYLDKRIETVVAMFGTAAAGGTFVPVNPLLKTVQVGHILWDCNVRFLITSAERLKLLAPALGACLDLHTVVYTGHAEEMPLLPGIRLVHWEEFIAQRARHIAHRCIDTDMTAILYTSGSTGKPKGVVLSHRNLLAGAQSVAQYLENTQDDRILALLPLSFDYGLSQLTTAFLCGATVVLMNYLLPRDVVRIVRDEGITGLAAVPPLWMQLAQQEWPRPCTLRYLTNSGGAMPLSVLETLRSALPEARVFLMYGLTEAFRSTYLPPEQLDRRPDSIGRAIPNAEVMVVRPDGSLCNINEPGELVHRGSLVSLGYWNDPDKTAERFRPAPGAENGLPFAELAVWSGDTVRMDEEGYLYFVGRRDDMIKVSGYRISPTEIEEALYASGAAAEAAAFGVPHPTLGQAVVAVVTLAQDRDDTPEQILRECRRLLPSYMEPKHIELRRTALPRNPNGKIDRKALQADFRHLFESCLT